MDIEEARYEIAALRNVILDAIREFETKTDLSVRSVDIRHMLRAMNSTATRVVDVDVDVGF